MRAKKLKPAAGEETVETAKESGVRRRISERIQNLEFRIQKIDLRIER